MAEVREALLDAAYDAVASGAWTQTRMADVAAAAGVSRQTLYNEFGTKDTLAAQLTLRELGRFLDEVERTLDHHQGSPSEAIREAVHTCLRLAADNPLVKASLTGDGSLLPYLTTRGEGLLVAAREHFLAHLTDHWPDITTRQARALADVVVRLTVSHVVLPTDPPDVVAAGVADIAARLLGDDR
jgi:AcrR family transcriptional regulator